MKVRYIGHMERCKIHRPYKQEFEKYVWIDVTKDMGNVLATNSDFEFPRVKLKIKKIERIKENG